MFRVALYQPEIPPNTGNIIRLCANAGAELHLIKPLGFHFEDAQLRRAGLDYHEWAQVRIHDDWTAFLAAVNPRRILACSTKGTTTYADVQFRADDVLLFGPESRGLPASLLHEIGAENVIRIPMQPNNRSLNLANAVAVILYEAWRQHRFAL
jgi:tRNA (cytidine/uridine-2'-O-)-methyltransferase